MNTIYFIGLFLFMNATSSDPTVHVIIPQTTVNSAVQAHTLVFMYPTGMATLLGNWGTTQNTHFDAAWDYVELHLQTQTGPGDRISFQVPQTNQAAAVPPELAHLQKKCTKFASLKQGFNGPVYPDAPAVIDVPYGVLTAITTYSQDATNWRMDTRLTYASNGPTIMTIANGLSVRSLVLPQGVCGIMAYIPTTALQGVLGMGHTPDATAFFDMMQPVNPNVMSLDCTNSNAVTTLRMARPPQHERDCTPTTTPWVPRPATPKTPNNTARANTASLIKTEPIPVVPEGPSCPLPFTPMNTPCPPGKFMNADCSNTQWP